MVNNPSEFRELLRQLFLESPLTIGGQAVPAPVLEAAIEEIIWASVQNYVGGDVPNACQKIVGMFFISLIERHQKDLQCAATDSPSSSF